MSDEIKTGFRQKKPRFKLIMHRAITIWTICQREPYIDHTCQVWSIWFDASYRWRTADDALPTTDDGHTTITNRWERCVQVSKTEGRGYKTWVQSQTHIKAQWLAAWWHVSPSSQSLRFILSLRINSSFITSRPGVLKPFNGNYGKQRRPRWKSAYCAISSRTELFAMTRKKYNIVWTLLA